MEEKRKNNNEITKEKLKMALIIFNTKYSDDDFVYRITIEAINQYYEKNINFDISIPLIISNFLLFWNPPYIIKLIKPNLKGLIDWFNKNENKNKEKIKDFREKDISSLEEYEKEIKGLFSSLCEILKPVATAKTLHLLAPKFFPLWDTNIAKGYDCEYTTENASEKYFEFCCKIKERVEEIKQNCMIKQIIKDIKKIKEIKVIEKTKVNDEIKEIEESKKDVNICELKESIEKKSLLKIIDEYNWLKYTKKFDLTEGRIEEEGKEEIWEIIYEE